MSLQRFILGPLVIGALLWLVLVVVCVLPTPPPATPTPTLPLIVVPASPTVYQFPTMTPYAPFDFLPVRSPEPSSTPTAVPTDTPTPEPASTRVPATMVQRG